MQCSSHSILQNIKQKKWCNLISWIYTEKSLPRLCKIVTLYPFIYKSEFLVWNLCFLATYPTNVFAESENAKCTFFTMVCLLFLQGEIEEKFVWVSLYFWWLGQSPIKRYDPPYCCFSRFIDSSLPPSSLWLRLLKGNCSVFCNGLYHRMMTSKRSILGRPCSQAFFVVIIQLFNLWLHTFISYSFLCVKAGMERHLIEIWACNLNSLRKYACGILPLFLGLMAGV